MVKLVIANANDWKRSIDAIAALIDEGTFEFSEAGVELKAMDPSQIDMVDFKMPKKGFKTYDVESKQSIGIDFSELSRVTKRAKPDDSIEMVVTGNKLDMKFSGKTTKNFTLPLIESSSHPNEPKIEFDAEIKASANELKDILGDVELVSNYVILSAASSGLQIRSESETGKVEVNFPKDALMEVKVTKESRAMFPLEYLKNMVRNTDMTTIVNIKLKADAPLRLEYSIGEGTVSYFLAPRIEEKSM